MKANVDIVIAEPKIFDFAKNKAISFDEIKQAILSQGCFAGEYVYVCNFAQESNERFGERDFQANRCGHFGKTHLFEWGVNATDSQDGEKYYYYKEGTLQELLVDFDQIVVNGKGVNFDTWQKISCRPKGKLLDMEKKAKACWDKYKSQFVAPEYDDRNYIDFAKFYLQNISLATEDDVIFYLIEAYKTNGKIEKLAQLFENHSNFVYVALFFAEAQFCLPNPDYKKVFEYFNHAKTLGSLVAMQRLALMYKLGLGVQQDVDKAYQLHMQVFDYIKKGACTPEVMVDTQLELAQIELQRGNKEDAMYNLRVALVYIQNALKTCGGYGKKLLDVLNLRYKLKPNEFDLCQADKIVFALQKPCTVTILGKTKHVIKSFYDNGKLIVKYKDNYFNGVTKFVRLCQFGGKTFYQKFEFAIFEVEYE